MNKQEETIKTQKIYDGKVVNLFLDEVKCPNQNIAQREIVKHPGGVCVLAFDDKERVILEKQYRYAFDEIVYELPAGKLEKGENPLDAAKREFEEETGFKVCKIESMGCIYPTCGYSNEIIYLFYASKIEKGTIRLDDDEDIEIIYVNIDELLKMIKENKIKDSKTICLISKYLLLNNAD